jgi:hypothetical protein
MVLQLALIVEARFASNYAMPVTSHQAPMADSSVVKVLSGARDFVTA